MPTRSLFFFYCAVSFAGMCNGQDLRKMADLLQGALPAFPLERGFDTVNVGKIHPDLLSVANDVRSIREIPGGSRSPERDPADDLVAVTLIASNDSDVAALERAVLSRGGSVSEALDNTVLARIPAAQIASLASINELYYAAPQATLYPLQEDSRSFSEGVKATGADLLHRQGLTGKNVKVGILDFGFQNYSRLVSAGQLPQPGAVRAWSHAQNFESGTSHGTACAEIVHAMAPDATLYLAAMNGVAPSMDQFALAAQWLADQGVSIISFSGGTHEGPHNGNAVMDKIVERIVSRYHILWLNGAGNEGESHWSGIAAAANHDGWIDVRGASPYLIVRPRTGIISLLVTWDDWGANPQLPEAFQDIDAYLFRYDQLRNLAISGANSSNPRTVAKSEIRQNGRAFPIERIGPLRVNSNDTFVLLLRAKNVTRPVRIHVYSLAPSEMEPTLPEGSIIIPATSRSAVAVGAVNVATKSLEPFSSRGPTDDSRLKPDLAAPDNNSSEAATGGRFGGTSAACPHAAGFAALLKEKYPLLHEGEFRQKLLESVRRRGSPTPNNLFGSGEIDAETMLETPSDSLLDTLTQDAESFQMPQLRLGVHLPKSNYAIGEPIRFQFSTSAPCYCLLAVRDARGHYDILASGRTAIGAGYHTVPDNIGATGATVTEPTGNAEILLIGSLAPIQWPQVGAGHSLRVSVASFSYVVHSSSKVSQNK